MAKKFKHSYEVCFCKHVTLGEIIYAIEHKNASTIEQIGKITDAGTVCGCCKSKEDDYMQKHILYLDQILKKFKNEK
jgi:NAD(P)H-nitrite reductase large subunit